MGHRCTLDPTLLWLWPRPESAALIQPLAWEFPYALGVALKRHTPQKKKKKRERERKVFHVYPALLLIMRI